jgi:hypothetical protein
MKAMKIAKDVNFLSLPKVIYDIGHEIPNKSWPEPFAKLFDDKNKLFLKKSKTLNYKMPMVGWPHSNFSQINATRRNTFQMVLNKNLTVAGNIPTNKSTVQKIPYKLTDLK